MLLKIFRPILFVLAVVISTPSFGQEGSLFLAGISLKLGMSQVQVMDSMGKNYDLLETKGTGVWLVIEKPANNLIGSVEFKAGKLIRAYKGWGHFRGEALNLAKALFSLLSNLDEDGRNSAFITIQMIREPTSSTQIVKMKFRDKAVQLDIGEGEILGPARISIQEILEP